ncbi:MAG: glycine zipper domain-containing protein [Phycisphaerales bacterium]
MVTAMRGTSRSGRSKLSAAVVAGALMLGATGCNNALEGGLSGAGMGALAGMAIGSVFGQMGAGAAIGAAAGALGGVVIGDQNQRRANGM